MGYSVVNLDEIEPSGPGDSVRFVRRSLAVEAFGVNWFELPPNAAGLEHDERSKDQEEVLGVIHGSGSWLVDGERVPAREGTFLRIDPESRRQAIAGPAGMTFIAIGARRGSYEPRGPF
jgi:mannose-6-phosphate isomerase-like protein (cupin superfamily)